MAALTDDSPSRPRATPRLGLVLVVAAAAVLAAIGLGPASAGGARTSAAGRTDAKIGSPAPATLDPAAAGDVGTASVTAQLYESLTTFDSGLVLRPALAQSWDVATDGRQVVFHLRPGLTFSDGTALTADDVVGSWLRLVNPRAPSPLSALLLGVRGVRDFLAGRATDPASVGIHAVDGTVVVDLDAPGSDFPAIVASPSFGVVPPSIWRDRSPVPSTDQVVSGGYSISAASTSELTLTANARYWAGAPVIPTIHLITDIGNRNPVAAFQAGDVDSIQIGAIDASWIAFDSVLGPQLRRVPELSLTYLGFDVSRPPFDNLLVRRAVGEAVDWTRVVQLAAAPGQVPADSMVPAGIPGRGTASWLPVHDPAGARALLAQAGYPNGAGLPPLTLGAGGEPYAEGIAADLQRELGLTVRIEDDTDHYARLSSDSPAMWELGWIADYPGPNDFLGVLLGSDSTSNTGKWQSPAFDAALATALGTRDPAAAQAGYEQALGIVQRAVPAVPLSYGDTWALSRTGLLGAAENGLGFKRLAGLSWAR
ncbi:MAG TPA: peptide ABC transporter substrate-binding protein [Candidatus Binatus sp.]|nr:peptide ABC transporter substrate-binding protein [Candidatus Binatus sp.]